MVRECPFILESGAWDGKAVKANHRFAATTSVNGIRRSIVTAPRHEDNLQPYGTMADGSKSLITRRGNLTTTLPSVSWDRARGTAPGGTTAAVSSFWPPNS